MGFSDFFKNIFGKKPCAFCGEECGMMSRTKIRDGDFICSKCDDSCSFHIKKYRFAKDELHGHMEYMKRSDRIYNEAVRNEDIKPLRFPSATCRQGIEFFDEIGMFRIIDSSKDNDARFPKEMFRYDQVVGYEIYIKENEPAQQGEKKSFEQGGIIITLAGTLDKKENLRKGLYAHPYITDKITVCFAKSEREKENYMKYAENAVSHFDYIFGVKDDENALFGFGMNKKEKRDLFGAVGFAKTAVSAVKVAKNGGEIDEDTIEEINKNMAYVEDAVTGGLAEYTRRADAAEEKANL